MPWAGSSFLQVLRLIPALSLLTLCFCCCIVQNAVPEPPVKAPGTDFSYLTDLYHGEFPKVLIQLPMYNEDAHCDLIIQRCCKVKWPSHRILIQVCTAGGYMECAVYQDASNTVVRRSAQPQCTCISDSMAIRSLNLFNP